MLVPISWLKDYVDINIDVNELADRLTLSGSNVEGIEHFGKEIKNVVIGRILKIEKHPAADKLLVTKIHTGDAEYQIITGATNINENDLVPVALPGAVVHGGMKIKPVKFRGLQSDGMLCSAGELGFDDHGLPKELQEGILILPEDAPLGKDIKEYLNLEDEVIDFEITPNRPDCLSIIGLARETAATFEVNLNLPKIILQEKANQNADEMVSVKIEAQDLCSRYIARIIEDVKIGPSPLWMQRRLQTAGVRPINNIVDITNYVMLELGQPLHAFDYDKVKGHSIIVRRPKDNEIIVTLDNNKRELSSDMLIIADEKDPIAIAGVMGGLDSEISSTTSTIILESANFARGSIRKTSRKLALRSEASMRFEKGIDPNLCSLAADRACQLIEQLGIGTVVKGCVDVFPGKISPTKIKLRPERINKMLGTAIEAGEMINILHRLNFKIEEDSNEIWVTVPTFRVDVKKEADLAEEIARIYGYDKLPCTMPEGDFTCGGLSTEQKLLNDIKQILVGNGYSEIFTYSFVSPKVFDNIQAPEDSSLRQAITLINPLGEEQSTMRTTLIPSMLEIVRNNLNQKIADIRLYESGVVYLPKELPLKELPYENKRLSIGLCNDTADFYELKRIIETLLYKLRITDYRFLPEEHFAFHPGKCAKILIDDVKLGTIGEIHPDVLEKYEIKRRVYIAEIDLNLLLDNASTVIEYKPLPKYPASVRDLAIIVEENVLVGDLIDAIKEKGGKLLEKVELFDVYRGGIITPGCKSLAFSLTYRAEERTLTDTEVNEVHDKVKSYIEEKFKGTLRE